MLGWYLTLLGKTGTFNESMEYKTRKKPEARILRPSHLPRGWLKEGAASLWGKLPQESQSLSEDGDFQQCYKAVSSSSYINKHRIIFLSATKIWMLNVTGKVPMMDMIWKVSLWKVGGTLSQLIETVRSVLSGTPTHDKSPRHCALKYISTVSGTTWPHSHPIRQAICQ